VKFHGVIDEAVLVSRGRSVTFLADPGAELTRSTGNGAIVTVQDDRTSLSVYDLSISNAPNSSSGIGCLIPSGAGAPTVSLTHVSITQNPGGGLSSSNGSVTVTQSTISGNQGGGLSSSNGSVTIAQSTISGNQGGGLSSSNGSVTVTQSTISGNQGGGILVSNGTFVIVGNVFFNNGGNTNLTGGVSIGTTTNTTNRLEFNSFALNTSQDGVGPAVQCIAGTFTAKNNIMSDNHTPTAGASQFGGTCSHAYSISRPGALPPGTGNGMSDPLFADPAKGDLHLQSTSPARHAADPGSDLTGVASRDIAGNVRVAPADIGAYVFK
jgi:hypothetical protein